MVSCWFLTVFCVLTFVTGFSSLKQTVSGPIPPSFMGMICWPLSLLGKVCSHDFLMVSCCFLWVLTIWSGFSFVMQIISWPILPLSFMRIYWSLPLLEKVSYHSFFDFFAVFCHVTPFGVLWVLFCCLLLCTDRNLELQPLFCPVKCQKTLLSPRQVCSCGFLMIPGV
jgi:hypothetical protein